MAFKWENIKLFFFFAYDTKLRTKKWMIFAFNKYLLNKRYEILSSLDALYY